MIGSADPTCSAASKLTSRCFAFFHPALDDEPIIFVEGALSKGLTSDLSLCSTLMLPILRPTAPIPPAFYSINNCLNGLRNVPFGNFLIKQVVTESESELPNIRTYATISPPLPLFSRALHDEKNQEGFTRELSRASSRIILAISRPPQAAAIWSTPSLLSRVEHPLAHRDVLSKPLRRLAFAYLTRAHRGGKLHDPVATFHLSNGARLEADHPIREFAALWLGGFFWCDRQLSLRPR